MMAFQMTLEAMPEVPSKGADEENLELPDVPTKAPTAASKGEGVGVDSEIVSTKKKGD